MVDVVFNELSSNPPAADKQAAINRMAVMLDVLKHAPIHGIHGHVRTNRDFHLTELTTGYSINNWVNDRDIPKEEQVFFLSKVTKIPYFEGVDEDILNSQELCEISFNEQSSPSFRASYFLDFPLLSFSNGVWEASSLKCDIEQLDDNGDIVELPEINLVNIANIEHFNVHDEWIKKRILTDIESMAELWTNKLELFPNLMFQADVENQITSIPKSHPHFRQIILKLFSLEDYFSSWDGKQFDKGAFAKCNPVSKPTLEGYREHYTFSFDDDIKVIANWHLYYTPGAGRIYFNASSDNKKGLICYINGKLPDTKS